MNDRVTGMRSSWSQSDLERAMEGKISKSGKEGLKAPTSAFPPPCRRIGGGPLERGGNN